VFRKNKTKSGVSQGLSGNYMKEEKKRDQKKIGETDEILRYITW
jgi:hypothetical protein